VSSFEWIIIPVTCHGSCITNWAAKVENKGLRLKLEDLDASHPYLAERGIRKETAEEFGIGYFSGAGSMADRIVIPIHNERGLLLAYAGRSIDGSAPKYKFSAGFHKSQVLYNLRRAIEGNLEARPSVAVVEGFFDCIKVHEAGFRCVALMDSSLSQEQGELLDRHFAHVVLLFDGDEAGRAATDECLLRLGRRLWTKAITLPKGKQPDQLSRDELQDLLAPKHSPKYASVVHGWHKR